MADEYGPTVRARRLATELRRLRERAGLTLENAAALVGESRTKLNRVELGENMPTKDYVQKILGAYGGTDQALRLALVDLAGKAGERGWWAPFGDVLSGAFVELEDDAQEINTWQVELPPGLLQEPRYARALIREFTQDPAEIERRLKARMTRQTILVREPAPVINTVLAEEVLHRPVGGAEVMREQLEALVAAARRPNVSIRVVPTEIGHHPAIGQGSMVIFKFASPVAPDAAYFETVAGGHYIEEVQQVKRCTDTFMKIAATALPEEESAELIASIAKTF